jgi:hypothetical protein
MIKNLAHALAGVALILVVGWLLTVPEVARSVHHHKGAELAVGGLLAVLALFVLVSLVRAVKGGRPKPQGRSGLPYAVPAKRR